MYYYYYYYLKTCNLYYYYYYYPMSDVCNVCMYIYVCMYVWGFRMAKQKNLMVSQLRSGNVERCPWLITHLLNQILTSEYASQDWRHGVFIPLHKKVSKELCSLYRGIALLCTAGKILSKILIKRLLLTDVLPETQGGFRRIRSYTDMIFTYTITSKEHGAK